MIQKPLLQQVFLIIQMFLKPMTPKTLQVPIIPDFPKIHHTMGLLRFFRQPILYILRPQQVFQIIQMFQKRMTPKTLQVLVIPDFPEIQDTMGPYRGAGQRGEERIGKGRYGYGEGGEAMHRGAVQAMRRFSLPLLLPPRIASPPLPPSLSPLSYPLLSPLACTAIGPHSVLNLWKIWKNWHL